MTTLSSTELRRLNVRFIERLEWRIRRRESESLRFSRFRLALFVVGAILTYLAFRDVSSLAGFLSLGAFFTAFGVVVYFHNRVEKSLTRHRIYREIKRSHVARIDRDWASLPPTDLSESPAEHAFGRDLNLTGDRSLHHLLDTSFTQDGSQRLKDWLLAGWGDFQAVIERQRLVRDLVPMTLFRDKLSLVSAVVTRNPDERWDGGLVLRWLQRHQDDRAVIRVLVGLSLLALLTATLLVLSFFGYLSGFWMLSLTIYAGIYLVNFRLYAHLFAEAEHIYYQLRRFRPVFQLLEGWKFVAGSALKAHCVPFISSSNPGIERPPSAYLKSIMWLSVAASAQKNEVLRLVLNLLLPWDLLFSHLLARYKMRLTERLPVWLDRISSLEAANSLATFGALHPDYCFPSFTEGVNGAVLKAEGLGHPLIDDRVAVRNDFHIESPGQLSLITGSNMSGKSTFLRTVGSNVVLAFAGGPVDAVSMELIPLRLYTSMNVRDSVTDGISYFYAEVKRLKKLLTELERNDEYPLLYLVDEIFRGTNNRERLEGSRALLFRFISGFGVGIVSTHDLELIHLEDEASGLKNLHFREEVAGGKMLFDYTLREGPCPTTNALKIMRLEGLPVDVSQ